MYVVTNSRKYYDTCTYCTRARKLSQVTAGPIRSWAPPETTKSTIDTHTHIVFAPEGMTPEQIGPVVTPDAISSCAYHTNLDVHMYLSIHTSNERLISIFSETNPPTALTNSISRYRPISSHGIDSFTVDPRLRPCTV